MMESKNVIYGNYAIKQGWKVGVKIDMGAGKLSFVASSPSNYSKMIDLGVALQCDSLKTGKFIPAIYLC